LGFDGELLSTLIPGFVPRGFARALGHRAYGFFLQTEDGSDPANRVVAKRNGSQYPQLDYDPARLPAAREEHRRLVRDFNRSLWKIGLPAAAKGDSAGWHRARLRHLGRGQRSPHLGGGCRRQGARSG
jgi:hypothetical protein